MSRLLSFFCAAALMLASALAHAQAEDEELDARRKLGRLVGVLFVDGHFAMLDREYADALRKEERLPSGVWKATRIVYSLRGLAPRRLNTQSEAEADKVYGDFVEKIRAWRREAPASTLAADLLVQHHIRVGFKHRGSGLSSQVTEEGWRGFREEIRKGLELLADPALPRDPVWYWAALNVSTYANVPTAEYLALLDEGVTKFPHVYDIYFGSLHRLENRWGGSTEAIEAVAKLAVRNTRQQEGSAAYARIYWSVWENVGDSLFDETEARWPTMRDAFRDLIARRPVRWNIDAFARFACLAKDGKTVAELVRTHGSAITFYGWPPQRAARCRNLEQE